MTVNQRLLPLCPTIGDRHPTIGDGQPQPYPMSSLLFRFRQQYPQGSLRCDLLDIDRGLYLVQASVTVDGIVLGTALAAQASLETAEDQARERVLALLNLSSPPTVEPPPPDIAKTKTRTKAPATSPQASTPPTPTKAPVTPPPLPKTVTPTPPPPPPVDPVPPVVDLPVAPAIEPELPFTLQSEIYSPPDDIEVSGPAYQNGIQAPLPADTNALITDNIDSLLPPESPPAAPSLFDQPSPPSEVTVISGDYPEEEEDAIDFSEIIARSNLELKRLGWTSDQGRNYLLQTYGKRSRQLLSDEELIEFLNYLEQQPTPE